MITTMNMYWFVKLDDIRKLCDDLSGPFLFFACMAFLFMVGGFIGKAVYALPENKKSDYQDEERASASRFAKYGTWFFIPFFIVSMTLTIASYMIPTTKQMCAIVVVPKIINAATSSETVQKIPSQIATLASEWLEQLRPSKEDVQKALDSGKKIAESKKDAIVEKVKEEIKK